MRNPKIAKLLISCISVGLTLLLTIQYITNEKPNAYKIYFSGKPIAYVENKEEYYKTDAELKLELKNRFPEVNFKEKVNFEQVHVCKNQMASKDLLKHIVRSNINEKVTAVLMKSNGHDVAVLANEKEIVQVLDNIKQKLNQKNKGKKLKLESKVTYIKEQVSLSQISTIEEATNKSVESENKPLIVFEEMDDKEKSEKVAVSRGGSLASLFLFPTQGVITSAFGMRWGRMHNGVDIGADYGTTIGAALEGIVSFAGWEDGYGKVIIINHGGGVETIYGHCNSIVVEKGETIKKSQKIGEVGSTGNSTGPHVHFEVRINGVAQNPLEYTK